MLRRVGGHAVSVGKFLTKSKKRMLLVGLLILLSGVLIAQCGGGGGGGGGDRDTDGSGDGGGDGDGGDGGGGGSVVDTTTPGATITSDGAGVIAQDAPIVLAFSETMDRTTLQLGGTMATPAPVVAWSDSGVQALVDDTLTISPPGGTWLAGPDQTLTVNVKDLGGNAVPTISFNFDIFTGVWFVHPSGNDSTGDGSPGAPFATIQRAIGAAASGEAVLVAAGAYEHDYKSDSTALVTMATGISLFGGYSATDWSQRDAAAHVTTLRDTTTFALGTWPPNRAVTIGSGVTAATILDGFTVEGAVGQYAAAIVANGGSATIRNCTISGGNPSVYSYGIWIGGNGSPVVRDSIVHGGGAESRSIGIFVDGGSAPEIVDNTIDGGTGGHDRWGLEIKGSPTVSGNHITGSLTTGVESSAIAIQVWGSADATITDNVRIDGGFGGANTVGIAVDTDARATVTGNPLILGGSGTTFSAGISSNSHAVAVPRFENNTIDGGTSPQSANGILLQFGDVSLVLDNTITVSGAGQDTRGIYVKDSASRIERNRVQGGGGNSSYGVVLNNSGSAKLINNLIHGGTGLSAFGVWVGAGGPQILHNTVYLGSGNSSIGIYLRLGATPYIDGNIILGSGAGSNGICVLEYDATSDPVEMWHNDLWGCPLALYYNYDFESDGNPSTNPYITDWVKVNELDPPNFQYIWKSDPKFISLNGADGDPDTMADNDWHFRTDGTSPCVVTRNFIQHAFPTAVNEDKDLNPRPGADTDYTSLGAYEWDGACAE